MPKVFHLIAYRRTGKDALVSTLKGVTKFGFRIYGKKGSKLSFANRIKRVAYADVLKKTVCSQLKLPKKWLKDGTFEKYKDKMPDDVETCIQLRGAPLRYHCKNLAKIIKEKRGKMYFVNAVKKEIDTHLKNGYDVFITDTRYPYEVFEDSITIRIFRSEIQTPEEFDDTERSMDNYLCDFLVCKTDNDFSLFVKNNKLYQDFVYQGLIDSKEP